MCVCVCVYICICMYINVCICICIHTYMYMYIYIYIYIYIYRYLNIYILPLIISVSSPPIQNTERKFREFCSRCGKMDLFIYLFICQNCESCPTFPLLAVLVGREPSRNGVTNGEGRKAGVLGLSFRLFSFVFIDVFSNCQCGTHEWLVQAN